MKKKGARATPLVATMRENISRGGYRETILPEFYR